ncbi:MAG: M61 family metallopeptidase [Bacteroidetes bacterium]|nr:M61 family metallopeptidase [Bacteroidota bacterium]
MKKFVSVKFLKYILIFGIVIYIKLPYVLGQEKNRKPELHYTVSMTDPANHLYKVDLECNGWTSDTIDFKMPQWMPGYYQIMNYYKEVSAFSAKSADGKNVSITIPAENTWRVVVPGKKGFRISYNLKAERRFVANSFLDTTHGYIVPPATFMYIKNNINTPVRITVKPYTGWGKIATGLEQVKGKADEFTAPDFDILYDCPLLVGNLDELPSFQVRGVKHRFIAFNPGVFDRKEFIDALQKTIEAGVEIIGEIPYSEYTFIGIGPGYGGIEHLNNTTVSFSGNNLDNPDAMERVLKFLAHEYFHHYNVKRIRPYELGPFDYDRENNTNLLWVSEGLSVYYEYLMVRRAGLMSDEDLLSSIAGNISTFENDPGRNFQSLIGSSYNTWSDGPFGNKPGTQDKSISYYEKGPVIGFILDLSIRNATKNNKSLDDVMRFLYYHYYKKLQRGFTDAEFQKACEDIAGISLAGEFEYVNTTKEIDYAEYLSYAGLRISEEKTNSTGKRKFTVSRIDNPDQSQLDMYRSMAGK